MAKRQENRALTPSDARPGKQIAFEGVAIEIVEVNTVKNPFGPDTYTVAYRVRDVRQSPPFVSAVAHLFVGANANLVRDFETIVKHYDQIKSTLLR